MTKRAFVVTRRRALEKSAARLPVLTVDASGSNLGQRGKIWAIKERKDFQAVTEVVAAPCSRRQSKGRRTKDEGSTGTRKCLSAIVSRQAYWRTQEGINAVRDISTDRITAYATHRLEENAKPSTVNYQMAVLRRAFRACAGKVAPRPEFSILHVNNPDRLLRARAVRSRPPAFARALKPIARTSPAGCTRSELLTRQLLNVDFGNGWLR